MPFNPEFTRIEQFIPDDRFNPHRDLVRIDFGAQHMFVGLFQEKGQKEWGVALGDPTLSPSFTENLENEKLPPFAEIKGFRLDRGQVGSIALFSMLERPNRNIWISELPIIGLRYQARTSRLKISDVVVGKMGKMGKKGKKGKK